MSAARVADMSRNLRVVLSMVAPSPKTTGLGSLSPWMWRCPPKQLSVGLSFPSSYGRTGSGHDALHTCILQGWSSGLIDRVDAGETLWLDPEVPVIHVGKELGTIIEQSAEISQHKSCDRADGSDKETGREGHP